MTLIEVSNIGLFTITISVDSFHVVMMKFLYFVGIFCLIVQNISTLKSNSALFPSVQLYLITIFHVNANIFFALINNYLQ